MEKYVKLTEEEYKDLVETHERAHQKSQDILNTMIDTGGVLVIKGYPRTFTIYGGEPMAIMLNMPLWRIIRAKFNKKKILEKAFVKCYNERGIKE